MGKEEGKKKKKVKGTANGDTVRFSGQGKVPREGRLAGLVAGVAGKTADRTEQPWARRRR